MRSKVCYQCGLRLEEDVVACPRCDAMDHSDREARPIYSPPLAAISLRHPWCIQVRNGTTVLISGMPGSGKTTCCIELEPDRILTSEQDIEPVKDTWYRIHGPQARRPLISQVRNWEDVERDLSGLGPGQKGVIDSVSKLGATHEIDKIVMRCIQMCQERGAIGFFIAQYNKDGGVLGPNALLHDVDAVAMIEGDKSGFRKLAWKKNRLGGEPTTYFRLGERGTISPEFRGLYTVEGESGQYRLHLYPMKGAVYAGIFDAISEFEISVGSGATCMLMSSIYPDGFVCPEDVDDRKAFAEKNNVRWIDPREIFDLWARARKEREDAAIEAKQGVEI